jgi:hypothetical protein
MPYCVILEPIVYFPVSRVCIVCYIVLFENDTVIVIFVAGPSPGFRVCTLSLR